MKIWKIGGESRNEIVQGNDIRLRSAMRFGVRTGQYELR
jgi:hypothetical protein